MNFYFKTVSLLWAAVFSLLAGYTAKGGNEKQTVAESGSSFSEHRITKLSDLKRPEGVYAYVHQKLTRVDKPEFLYKNILVLASDKTDFKSILKCWCIDLFLPPRH